MQEPSPAPMLLSFETNMTTRLVSSQWLTMKCNNAKCSSYKSIYYVPYTSSQSRWAIRQSFFFVFSSGCKRFCGAHKPGPRPSTALQLYMVCWESYPSMPCCSAVKPRCEMNTCEWTANALSIHLGTALCRSIHAVCWTSSSVLYLHFCARSKDPENAQWDDGKTGSVLTFGELLTILDKIITWSKTIVVNSIISFVANAENDSNWTHDFIEFWGMWHAMNLKCQENIKDTFILTNTCVSQTCQYILYN